jgi:hypothetical protein
VTGSECPAAFAQGARKLTAMLGANNVTRRAAAAGSPEVTESLPGHQNEIKPRKRLFSFFVTGSECPAAFAQGARKLTAMLGANNVTRRAAAAGSPEVTESINHCEQRERRVWLSKLLC